MNEEELVAAVVTAPQDEAPWMVYADWLLERNHPRGELIQLAAAAVNGDKAAAWRIRQLEADEDHLISSRLLERAMQWRFAFHRCFIKLAEFQRHAKTGVDAEAISALCCDPHAGLLETVVLDVHEVLDEPDPITRRSEHRYARADVGESCGDFARLRWLDHLGLHGVACDVLSHPTLRSLGTDSITCRSFRTDLPALGTLNWEAMSESDGLGTVLRQALPCLRSLGIARGYPSMIGELAGSPLARQLESLSFTTNNLATLTTLITHAAAFPRLRQLSVRGIYEDLALTEADALRRAVEQAYPIDELDIPWNHLLPDPVVERQPAPGVETVEVDDQSRRPDGTIDALARWNQGDD